MSELTALANRLAQVLLVMKSARRNQKNMSIWADDTKAVEDAHQVISTLAAQKSDLSAQLAAARSALASVPIEAVDSLDLHQQQIDEDGVMVGVSRQAADEVAAAFRKALAALSSLAQEPAGQSELGAELPTVKPDALINIETWERSPLTPTVPARSASPGVTEKPHSEAKTLHPDLDALLKKATDAFNALPADKQEEMLRKQRESWVRGEMELSKIERAVPAVPAGSASPGVTIGDLWAELLDKDDRTSPEEHPEMALISFDEFADFIERAHPTVKVSGDAAEMRERGFRDTGKVLNWETPTARQIEAWINPDRD